MASKTSWVAGAGQGLTWGNLFGTEANTLANANCVLSSITVANGTPLDQFMDISLQATIASSTIAVGANFAFWLMELDESGGIFGDNSITTTPSATVPGLFIAGTMPLRTGASQTTLYGYIPGMLLPPGSFAMGIQNNSGFTLTACTVKYRTFNVNLNA